MSNVEFRPARAEEMSAVASNAARQMGMSPAMFTGMPPEWTLCAFVDGEVASTYAAWPLTIRFNGTPVAMAGVTWVSTHPAHRRRGYVRTIIREHFAAMHEERRQAWAGLHPAWVAIYRRFGYGLITNRTTYRVDPRDIRWAHPLEPVGRMRELDVASEFATLVDVYRRFREERNALVHRGRAMWDAGPIAPPPPGFARTILVYEEDGVAQGYVVVVTGNGAPSPQIAPPMVMRVEDLFALTPSAHRAIWSTLSGFDNVREITWNNAPPDDPFRQMVLEPRLLNVSVRDGIMTRLVSVDDALAGRPYATEAVLRFELRDDFCPWNSGRWELVTGPDGSECRRIDGPVDLATTPDVLSMLAWGRLTASEASRAGLVEGGDRRLLDRWDQVLRTKYPPHEAEHTW